MIVTQYEDLALRVPEPGDGSPDPLLQLMSLGGSSRVVGTHRFRPALLQPGIERLVPAHLLPASGIAHLVAHDAEEPRFHRTVRIEAIEVPEEAQHAVLGDDGLVIALMVGAMRPESTRAQSPTPSPALPGHRIEVPEAGIALTAPAGWGFRVEMLETDWVKDAGVGLDAAIWRVLDLWRPDGDPEEATERCSIGMLRVGEQSLEILTTSDATPAPGQVPAGWTHSTTEILVPAGPATRIDMVGHEPDRDWYSTTYNLVGPNGRAWLGCDGPELPGDHWLSIAETLEFLPVEE